jgi:hypothetical protein
MEAHFVTERQSDNAIFDFDQARILALYADGHTAAEIGAEYRRGVNWVYQQMAQFPDRYEEAKARRQAIRTGRYRRIAALSQGVQIKTLETYQALLDKEDKILEELAAMELQASQEDWEGTVSRFNEACELSNHGVKGKNGNMAPIPTPESITLTRTKLWQLGNLRAQASSIAQIKAKLKDISLVGAAAEKQADLDEGKPTERVDNQGVQIVVFNKPQEQPVSEGESHG